MAKKSKIKSQNPISFFLRIVKANRNAQSGVSNARINIDEKDFHLVISHSYRNEVLFEEIFGVPFKDNTDLKPDPRNYNALETDKYLTWYACILSHFSEEISLFNVLKDEYDSLFLKGYKEASLKVLNKIEKKFGVSIWLVDKYISTHHEIGGLKQQKKYLEQILTIEDIDPILAIFSHFFSKKNEISTTISSYIEDIEPIFKNSQDFEDYVIYHLIPTHLSEIKNIYSVLFFEEKSSIIDRYIAFKSMLELAFLRQEISNKKTLHIINIVAKIKDSNLNKLHTLASGNLDDYKFDREIIKEFDEYTLGTYSKKIKSESIELEARNYIFRDSYYEIDKETSIYNESLASLISLLCHRGDINNSKRTLQKVALRSVRSSFSNQIIYLLQNLCVRQPNNNPLPKLIISDFELENPWMQNEFYRVMNRTGKTSATQKLVKLSSSHSLANAVRVPFEKGKKVINNLRLPSYRKLVFLAESAYNNEEYNKSINYLNFLEHSENTYLNAIKLVSLVKNYFKKGNYLKCFEILVTHYFYEPTSIYSYDLGLIIEKCEEFYPFECYNDIYFCITLSISSKILSPEYERKLSDCFENILDNLGIKRPSRLTYHIEDIGKKETIYILKNIATTRIMDDFTEFSSMDDIDNERVLICQKLIEVDPKNEEAYSREIKSIIEEAKVSKLVKDLNSSKIYFDEQGVYSQVEEYSRNLFVSYKNLLRQPELSVSVEKISALLTKILKISDNYNEFTLPSSDRESLFQTLFGYIINQLANEPAYGLDTHLSTGIRHGSFEGIILSAFAKRGLVIDSEEEKEKRFSELLSCHFVDDIEVLGSSTFFHSNTVFTKRIRSYIDHYLSTLLHIKKSSDSSGLINIFRADRHLKDFQKTITVNTTFQDFWNSCIYIFWDTLEESLSTIRKKIGVDLRNNILRDIEIFEKSFPKNASIESKVKFRDLITNVKTEFEANIIEACEWFTVPSLEQHDDFNINIAVEVALKQVNNCYVSKPLKPKVTNNSEIIIKGKYFSNLVDVLFILLQNIIRHSYHTVDSCSILVNEKADKIQISITNKLPNRVPIHDTAKTVEELNVRYGAQASLDYASTEGGSGLSKIWRIFEYGIQAPHELNITLDEKERCFITNILIEHKEISVENFYS